jgi:hypothetical protein
VLQRVGHVHLVHVGARVVQAARTQRTRRQRPQRRRRRHLHRLTPEMDNLFYLCTSHPAHATRLRNFAAQEMQTGRTTDSPGCSNTAGSTTTTAAISSLPSSSSHTGNGQVILFFDFPSRTRYASPRFRSARNTNGADYTLSRLLQHSDPHDNHRSHIVLAIFIISHRKWTIYLLVNFRCRRTRYAPPRFRSARYTNRADYRL